MGKIVISRHGHRHVIMQPEAESNKLIMPRPYNPAILVAYVPKKTCIRTLIEVLFIMLKN